LGGSPTNNIHNIPLGTVQSLKNQGYNLEDIISIRKGYLNTVTKGNRFNLTAHNRAQQLANLISLW